MDLRKADLHVHTYHSDGRFSPEDVVRKAHTAGLSVLAVTDHDTVDGLDCARQACATLGIDFVPGAEISAEAGKDEIHLLAYGFDSKVDTFRSLLLDQRTRRRERAEAFILSLREAGLQLPSDVDIGFGLDGAIGRPHLAKLIVDSGAAVGMDAAFAEYLVPGSDTFVPKVLPPAEEVMNTVHEAGGVCVLAHPGHSMSDLIIRRLIELGLRGIEVFHPSHDESLTAYYGTLAKDRGLIATGGSDYHGWRDGEEQNLGAYYISWPLEGNLFGTRTL